MKTNMIYKLFSEAVEGLSMDKSKELTNLIVDELYGEAGFEYIERNLVAGRTLIY